MQFVENSPSGHIGDKARRVEPSPRATSSSKGKQVSFRTLNSAGPCRLTNGFHLALHALMLLNAAGGRGEHLFCPRRSSGNESWSCNPSLCCQAVLWRARTHRRFARVQFNNIDNSQVRIQSAPPRPARCARMRVPGQIIIYLFCGQTVERRAAGVGVMRSRTLRVLTLCLPVVVVMAPAAACRRSRGSR